MAHPTSRLSTLPSHLRQSSAAGGLTSSSSAASGAGASPALVARINDKKAELESLRQLRDLSADLAGQMEALQGKLEILGNGTEGELYHLILFNDRVVDLGAPRRDSA